MRVKCDDPRCKSIHCFSIRDWEVDALYFTLRKNGDPSYIAVRKVIDKLKADICSSNIDLYLFLGNISNYPQNFTIVGLWKPKKHEKSEQRTLFEL